jgi:hypothetical protein
MTETQERFLRTVLTRVSLDSVVEMHLFPPIRRGTMETGMAVIATVLPPAPLTVLEKEAEPELDVHPSAPVEGTDLEMDVQPSAPIEGKDLEMDADTSAPVEGTDLEMDVDASAPIEGTDLEIDVRESVTVDEALEMDAHASATVEDAAPETTDSDSITAEDAPVHAPRLRILTAAYRHTIKGIDRGKWTVDVQEEADAPLTAVEAVLRGVRQRSAEAADPELVSLETLAALIAPVRVAPAA